MGIVNPITLLKGLKADFMKAFNNGEPSMAAPFVMETTSTSKSEKYGWLGAVPQLKKWVDERVLRGLKSFDYEIVNEDYEATLEVDRNALEDDQMGAIKIRIGDLAKRAKTHPWKLLVELIMNGETKLCYDGQAFFSASHQEGDSGVLTNIVTGTGSSVSQVMADFISARALMQSFKDDQGEPYNEGELQLVVVAHPSMRGVFDQVFTANLINNTTNTLVGAAKVIYTSRFTDANDWYLFETSSGMKPFIQQNRRAVEFKGLEDNTESAFMRKQYLYGVDYRVGLGFGLWQKAVKVKNA